MRQRPMQRKVPRAHARIGQRVRWYYFGPNRTAHKVVSARAERERRARLPPLLRLSSNVDTCARSRSKYAIPQIVTSGGR